MKDNRKFTEHKLTNFRLSDNRCKRCHEIPREQWRKAQFERYAPYCSYHCQEWAQIEDAQAYINEKYNEQHKAGDV